MVKLTWMQEMTLNTINCVDSKRRHDVNAIVTNIRQGGHYLSRSCRGVETEVIGNVVDVHVTARGLTLDLDTGSKVVWHCAKPLAKQVREQWLTSNLIRGIRSIIALDSMRIVDAIRPE